MNGSRIMQDRSIGIALPALALALVAPSLAHAQFTSGSNGSDGALNLTAATVFNPATLNLDADNDGVYHFTTINIGPGITVTLRADVPRLLEGRPIIWLASGAVTISGTLVLDGEGGHSTAELPGPSIPGVGGFQGGAGGQIQNNFP